MAKQCRTRRAEVAQFLVRVINQSVLVRLASACGAASSMSSLSKAMLPNTRWCMVAGGATAVRVSVSFPIRLPLRAFLHNRLRKLLLTSLFVFKTC